MLATSAEKQECLDIIIACSREVPSIDWITGTGNHRNERLRALASFMVESAIARKGAILSSNKKGLILFFRADEKPPLFRDMALKAQFLFRFAGITRLRELLKREMYISNHLPSDKNYFNCWFWGVHPDARGIETGAAKELKDLVFEKSSEENLPIYLQTSIPKNRLAYERYGFHAYHEWKIKEKNLTMWFMKREPDEKKIPAELLQQSNALSKKQMKLPTFRVLEKLADSI